MASDSGTFALLKKVLHRESQKASEIDYGKDILAAKIEQRAP
jgi:hypothetical protein